MCTRFVYNEKDVITGFNFDIDTAVWKHKVIAEKERFYIGILRPDGVYHSYHGVNQNGNAGTLLYVHGNAWHQALVRLLQICKTQTKPGSIKHCKSGKFPQALYSFPV